MAFSRGGEPLTFKTGDVLAKLRTNRAEHRKIFLEAQQGYRNKVIEVLEQRLTEARSGKRVRHQFQITEPADMTKHYDRAIAMLEMTTQETVELDGGDFSKYILDEWDWSDQFKTSNTMYSQTAQSKYADE